MHPSTRGLRILIAGINYWPEHSGNAPYTTGLAEYLAAQGADVTVVTGMPYYPEWKVYDRYQRKLRDQEVVNGVHIRRFRTYIPPKQSALRRIGFETGFLVNSLMTWGLPKPDVVLGIVPSLSGAALANYFAKRFRVPYGLLFQDLVGGAAAQSGIPGGKSIAGATKSIEAALARGAHRVAIVSEGFRQYLASAGVPDHKIIHLRNWTHVARPTRDRAEMRRHLGWSDEEFTLLHAGAMGLKQDLGNVVEAARLAERQQLPIRFVLMGDGSQRSTLRAQSSGLSNIDFRDPCSGDLFPDVLAAADALLVNERPSLIDMALPSKLTSYMVSGRPIIAAVSPAGWTAKQIEASDAGLVVPAGEPNALLTGLKALSSDPALQERLGTNGANYAALHFDAATNLSRAEAFILAIAHQQVAVESEHPTLIGVNAAQ